MTLDWAVAIILLGLGGLGLFIRTYIKSTVSESIRHQFETERQKMREEFEREIHTIDRRDKFKLAALDKRLEVHQKAYALSKLMSSLLSSSGSEARDELAVNCDIFWNENNLYLTNEIRKQFRNSFLFFNTYLFERQENASLKDVYPEEYEIEKKEMKEEIKKLRDLPSLIERSVDLESMSIEGLKKEEE